MLYVLQAQNITKKKKMFLLVLHHLITFYLTSILKISPLDYMFFIFLEACQISHQSYGT